MKKRFLLFVLTLLLVLSPLSGGAFIGYASEKTVYLGGMPAGFEIQARGAYVAGISDVITKTGIESPAKNAGIRSGDIIYSINGAEINSSADIERVLTLAVGEIEVEIMRCKEKITLNFEPAVDISGNKKLGVFIKDGISGIGTVTYIDEDMIATLGHPVLDNDKVSIDLVKGGIFECTITGYIKGEKGKAGELKGAIFTDKKIAEITKNTEYGVFGKLVKTYDKNDLTEIAVGDGKPGNASIFTTINGNKPEEYSISIVKAETLISDTKNFVIKITDKRLLDATSGIVQGMSGSPIVQDGKLIGAVTHVFISDPTRGFGISIKNMLNQ